MSGVDEKVADQPQTITAYKAFGKDFVCRGHKFEIGETYTLQGKLRLCENGFHAVRSPMDAWMHYSVGDLDTRYGEVELTTPVAEETSDTKIASLSITVKAEITLPEFIKRGVQWIIDATRYKPEDMKEGEPSSGNGARIGSSGYGARIGSSGDDARIGSSGYGARIGSSGYGAQIGSSGNGARLEISGERGVAASAGRGACAKGVNGTWISLAEFNDDGECIGFATGCVGRDGVPADVWLKASGGKLVQVT